MTDCEKLQLRITRRTRETDDIVALELRHSADKPLPAFSPGAHIEINVAPGVTRQYSLCNAPADRHRYVVGILNDPASRGGSKAIFENFREGMLVETSLPRNHFPLRGGKKSILLAGGIGITPLLCMAEALHSEGADFALHYCVRSRLKAAFRERIASSPFRSCVQFHCDDEDESQKLKPDSVFAGATPHTEIYVCGPGGFIDWICSEADRAGIHKDRVHFEYFNAKEVDTSQDHAFDVQVSNTGIVLHVPADKSVAEVLIEAGVDLYTSCAEGTCGTCMTRILEGVPEHRDVFLTEEEKVSGKVFTPCCSRSKTPLLILDL